jgi:hypothetical protein
MDQMMKPDEVLVVDVPTAGKMAGLSRQGSYNAAIRGDMPVITIGGLKRVPLKAWRAKLNGETA